MLIKTTAYLFAVLGFAMSVSAKDIPCFQELVRQLPVSLIILGFWCFFSFSLTAILCQSII